MTYSILYASHHALKNLLFFKHHIWDIYAYVPGNGLDFSKWKIKTKKYNEKTGKFSFDSLKYYDSKSEEHHPLTFNFGHREREKVSGLGIEVLQLQCEYELEREVIEKMCQLSDNGYVITSNDEVIMDSFSGSNFLIQIDLDAPSYSSLDVNNAILLELRNV